MPMQIKIRPQVYIFLSVLLLLIPFPWLSAWLIAVIFHELCHVCAVYVSGGKILSVTIAANGICMDSTPLTEGKRLLSVLSGPLGGLLPVALSRYFPRLAICCWLLSLYNLLPLLPLDGGRALQILIGTRKYFLWVERIFMMILTLLACYGTVFLRLGLLPLLVVALIWFRNRKFPCK